MAPFKRSIEITVNRSFLQANMLDNGYIKANIKQGNAKTKHKLSTNDADWQRLMKSEALNIDTAKGLQNKTFINLIN